MDFVVGVVSAEFRIQWPVVVLGLVPLVKVCARISILESHLPGVVDLGLALDDDETKATSLPGIREEADELVEMRAAIERGVDDYGVFERCVSFDDLSDDVEGLGN